MDLNQFNENQKTILKQVRPFVLNLYFIRSNRNHGPACISWFSSIHINANSFYFHSKFVNKIHEIFEIS